MFKPQGGSLHTDENMTERAPSFCCMALGPEEKKPKPKDLPWEVKEMSPPPYSN